MVKGEPGEKGYRARVRGEKKMINGKGGPGDYDQIRSWDQEAFRVVSAVRKRSDLRRTGAKKRAVAGEYRKKITRVEGGGG